MLPEGTQVKVTIAEKPTTPASLDSEASFFRRVTIDELAADQGVSLPCSFDELLGGWPEEGRGDKFEEAVAQWRKEEVRKGEF
jgi:hypothetical protein